MRMSFWILRPSGVWEATGVVAKVEFSGPLTFLDTSPFSEIVGIMYIGFAIFNVFVAFEAGRSLIYSAGVCGKAVGVTA